MALRLPVLPQHPNPETTIHVMKAIKFTEKIIINENPASVFDYTQDYKQRLSWDTFLKKAVLVNGATRAAMGVKAYCVAKNGLGMETEYVSFNPPRATAVKMTKGPWLFKNFLGSWTFKEMPGGETEVIFLYSFAVRFPFNVLGFFIRHRLQRNVQQRLLDLKHCIEKKKTQMQKV
jgi:ribosome-associated toxin RatA of RatAB toxin-antitoxin module